MTYCIYTKAHRHCQHLQTESGGEHSLSMLRGKINDVTWTTGANEQNLQLQSVLVWTSRFVWGDIIALHYYTQCMEEKKKFIFIQWLFRLFRQSDLLSFSFINEQPPHLHYEDFSFFIKNLKQEQKENLHMKRCLVERDALHFLPSLRYLTKAQK